MVELAWLAFQLVLLTVNIVLSPPPWSGSQDGDARVDPLTVYEIRTASDEEIAVAALEVPELVRRAEEAAVAHR